jgi:hypothetical protein
MKNPIKSPTWINPAFYGLQYADLKQISVRISHKAYYVDFRKAYIYFI